MGVIVGHSFDPDDPADVAKFLQKVRSADLPLVSVPPGRAFVRLIEQPHDDVLGTGPSAARFSDPRLGRLPVPELFHVLYAGRDLRTAFEETVVRDRTTGFVGGSVIRRGELARWSAGLVTLTRVLRLVDLREVSGNWRRFGLSIDELKGDGYRHSQVLSLGIHEHKSVPDGILYHSRYSSRLNIAVYGRAIGSGLLGTPTRPILDLDLKPILEQLSIFIVDDIDDEDEPA